MRRESRNWDNRAALNSLLLSEVTPEQYCRKFGKEGHVLAAARDPRSQSSVNKVSGMIGSRNICTPPIHFGDVWSERARLIDLSNYTVYHETHGMGRRRSRDTMCHEPLKVICFLTYSFAKSKTAILFNDRFVINKPHIQDKSTENNCSASPTAIPK